MADESNNFIKLNRKFMGSPFYSDSKYVHLWIHLLMKANWKLGKWKVGNQIINIEPGQFGTSRLTLSKETGIAPATIDRMLKAFQSEQQIEQQTFTKYRLISITNWHKYQHSEQQIEQQVSSKRTASEQQVVTIEEGKEGKKVKKEPLDPDGLPTGQLFALTKKLGEDEIPYSEIISYLNNQTGKNYRNTDGHKKHIKARWADGFRIDHFKAAINNQAREWAGTEMDKFLRPETLFGNKMDGYVNNTCDTPVLPKSDAAKGMMVLQAMIDGGSNGGTVDGEGDQGWPTEPLLLEAEVWPSCGDDPEDSRPVDEDYFYEDG